MTQENNNKPELETHELASAFTQELAKRAKINKFIEGAFPLYQEKMKDFDMTFKGYLIFPETDEYFSFCKGIHSVPSNEQIKKMASNGVSFTIKKPNLPTKKVNKN